MYKYEMDPTRTVGATEQTWDAGRMDGQTDRQTERVKPIYPQQLDCAGGVLIIGYEPLSEPMLIRFTDTYMWEMS